MGIRSGRLHDAVTQGILDAEVATLESAIDDIVNAGASAGTGVTIADAGEYYDGENAETVLQEVGAQLSAVDTELAQKASLAYLNEKTSYGVISGLGVTQQAVADMSVIVATGVIWMASGDRFEPTANNALAVTAADGTNPRIDIVYINSTGVITYLAGTAGATPAQPSTPAGGQLIATLLVTAGKTSILTADITDKRKPLLSEKVITPTFTNSWVADRTPVGYYKDADGVVHLTGSAKSGSTGVAGFTMIAGYRPAKNLRIPVAINGGVGVLEIMTSGGVYMPNATYTSLDGVNFSAGV